MELQDWLTAIAKAASFLRFRSTEVSDVVAEEYLRVSAALTDLECHLADIEPLLPKWIDTSDKLPGVLTDVLVHLHGRYRIAEVDRFGRWFVNGVNISPPKCWMPLPPPSESTDAN